jgi:GH18 family chitinase
MAFIEKYALDGIDVDIEFNLLPTIGDLYTPFVLELRDALLAKGKGISSALNVSGLHASVSQEALEAYDFINVMVYDKTGPWRPDTPGPHAPYAYAQEALDYWTKERKIPAHKLTLGVPFYGHDFEQVTSIAYKDLVERDTENAYRDKVGAIFYNGIPTVVKKTQLAKNAFGGIMIWELHQDAQNELSLLRAITQALAAGDCNGKAPQTYFVDSDGDGFGNRNKPFQACKRPRGYVANKEDCDDADRKVNPKNSNCTTGMN